LIEHLVAFIRAIKFHCFCNFFQPVTLDQYTIELNKLYS